MTPVDLDAIEARIAAATPGPWSSASGNTATEPIRLRFNSGGRLEVVYEPTWEADAELIAHAPTDLAALVAENERLRTVARAARKLMAGAGHVSEYALMADLDAALDALDAGGSDE